jgi:fatty-acid desaturase|tara:strand:- start:982 stop:1200 length:219 start_codon:yes stop_codon:yes gene_type:complete
MINKFLEWSFQRKADKIQRKTLQIVNLAPSEDWVERIVEIHPMRQVFWASIIQLCVFGFMLLSFWGIHAVVN